MSLKAVLRNLDKPDLPVDEPWWWTGNKSLRVRSGSTTVHPARVLWEHCFGPVLPGRRVKRIAGHKLDLNVYKNFDSFMGRAVPEGLSLHAEGCVDMVRKVDPETWDDILKDEDADLMIDLDPRTLRAVLRRAGKEDLPGAPI